MKKVEVGGGKRRGKTARNPQSLHIYISNIHICIYTYIYIYKYKNDALLYINIYMDTNTDHTPEVCA